jgi:metal-sulfur cluster biosynthetic enzyme
MTSSDGAAPEQQLATHAEAVAPESIPSSALPNAATLERLWSALREVEDPEIPVSLVDMGLIVAVDYVPLEKAAKIRITYTAMGCPAMDMIQDDIRARLLREPDVERVDIDVVWDPIWTHRRLSPAARASMRELGLAV